MIPYALCAAAFGAVFLCARRSLGWGLVSALAVGYVYGIVRANLLSAATHLLFDCAAAGLYLGAGPRIYRQIVADQTRHSLAAWATVLIGWPMLLFVLPGYDPMLQLVGLRGNAFLLPFLFLGAALRDEDLDVLAPAIAVFNIGAVVLGTVEFFTDVRNFFPRNALTEIIYKSNDLLGYTAYRIPSSFINAHAYAGTMVMTLPMLLVGLKTTASPARLALVYVGLGAALIGVFLAATRSHAVVLMLVVIVVSLFGRLGARAYVAWAVALLAVATVVSLDERLQRFTQLQDSAMVVRRIEGSVNEGVLDVVGAHPLGNGLAGGGTSIPYFLGERRGAVVLVENEWARLGIEQGTVGLMLWIAFAAWMFTRFGNLRRDDPTHVGRLAAWSAVTIYLATGLIGTGLLTSIPQSSLMLTIAGWVGVPAARAKSVAVPRNEGRALRRGWRRAAEV